MVDLRDFFAGMAMNGFITGCCSQSTSAPIGELSHSYMTQVAYQVADCMIEARKTAEELGAEPVQPTNSRVMLCPTFVKVSIVPFYQ